MKITKKVLFGIWWLGGRVATMLGVAVMLALTVGLASAALAAAPGDPFRLGQNNTINNAFTRLVGSNGGDAMLKVDNDSMTAGSRALDLRVEPGRVPLNVNADAGKATNLDADKVDGKGANQIGVNGLEIVTATSATNSNSGKSASATCSPGKVLVGSGYNSNNGLSGIFPDQEANIVIGEVIPAPANLVVNAYEEEPTSANWNVTARAICATAP